MELVRELFWTASLALVLSFLVAKLVALALAGDSSDRESELKSTSISDERVVAAEKPYEDSLRVQGSDSESRVEFFKEQVVQEVDHFQGKPVHLVEEIAEHVLQHRQEELLEEGSGKESETVGLPEKLLDREDKASVEKACDFDLPGVHKGCTDVYGEETLGNKGVDIIGVDSVTNDVVVARPEEEVNAVGDDSKSNEVGMHDESDEDDWEGIEKSELENVFAAAVKFVEHGAKDDDRLLNVGNDVQMALYGLHKVATEGPCYESQPMALKLAARAKWY
ncbi:hypothetical protein FNV43_RR11750 [Rhamnella rubrinervis]|uniref:ACB domain-containing protein n=1 Tax=Rhamnella rubrinervis TaxID=2594499 RepID=A0A8K0MI64_9ROSA|nr:hypothetical protein FNV43_RR11750 [Rhamnella rubrinervis]